MDGWSWFESYSEAAADDFRQICEVHPEGIRSAMLALTADRADEHEARFADLGARSARLGVPLEAWFALSSAFSGTLLPRLIAAYLDEPPRLAAAIQAMQHVLHRALSVIARGHASAQPMSARQPGLPPGTAHELRTPLNAIIGFAELLGDGHAGPLAPQQRELLADILESGWQLLRIIDEKEHRATADGSPAHGPGLAPAPDHR